VLAWEFATNLPAVQSCLKGKYALGAVSLLLVETSVTLRERKKAATRRALFEAVLELAVARGLDAVTVEAIADEANVSRRTFSNYFANKEEALLYGDQVRIGMLFDELRRRPATEPPWQALTRSAAILYADLDKVDPKWLAQLRLVRRHPSLLAQQIATHSALEERLAAEIANRSPSSVDEPIRSRVLAATFLTTLRTATIVWAEQAGTGSLGDAIAAGLACAAQRFT
jgi:AcrR family transcriptional regulator